MRNPKIARYTDEEDARMEETEANLTRCRIMERGVAHLLNNGDYASASEIQVAANVLSESVALRKDTEKEREAIRRSEMERHPKRHRVNPVPMKTRRRA